MTIWGLIQVVINIFLFVGLFVCIVRSPRRNQDDPRLSRGLQLLQSKISVLEDLSDKTDSQFQKIMSVIEQKVQEVQLAVATAERQLQNLKSATEKGVETTRLIQTGLGAEQVIERHNNEVYEKAARLAFEGSTIDEICEKLELSRGEVELIVKFNRDSLRTVASQGTSSVSALAAQKQTNDYSDLFEVPNFDASSLNKLGEEFRRATREAEEQNKAREEADRARTLGFAPTFQQRNLSFEDSLEQSFEVKSEIAQPLPQRPAPRVGTQPRELSSAPVVRKVVFPRIDSPDEKI